MVPFLSPLLITSTDTNSHLGIYTVLFILCIYIFRKRQINGQRGFQAVTVIMFLLCTAQSALGIASQGDATGVIKVLNVGPKFIENWLYVVAKYGFFHSFTVLY